jgi:hypothetical protein
VVDRVLSPQVSELMYEGSREGHLFPWGPHLGNQVGALFPGLSEISKGVFWKWSVPLYGGSEGGFFTGLYK